MIEQGGTVGGTYLSMSEEDNIITITHQLTIFAMFDSGNVYEYINFTVDTKKPKITKTEPRRGFANGIFEVEFIEPSEQNPNAKQPLSVELIAPPDAAVPNAIPPSCVT